MKTLNQFFIIAGLGIAFYFGYAGFEWFYVFVPGILFTLGWAVARPGGLITIKESDGVPGLIKLFTIQIIMMSLFAGVLFFIGTLVN